MSGRAILTDWALDDLTAIADHIGRDAVGAANVTVARILDAIDNVAEMPTASAIVPELDDPNVRQVRVRDYRIIFLVFRDSIQVIAVFHGARDIAKLLRERMI